MIVGSGSVVVRVHTFDTHGWKHTDVSLYTAGDEAGTIQTWEIVPEGGYMDVQVWRSHTCSGSFATIHRIYNRGGVAIDDGGKFWAKQFAQEQIEWLMSEGFDLSAAQSIMRVGSPAAVRDAVGLARRLVLAPEWAVGVLDRALDAPTWGKAKRSLEKDGVEPPASSTANFFWSVLRGAREALDHLRVEEEVSDSSVADALRRAGLV